MDHSIWVFLHLLRFFLHLLGAFLRLLILANAIDPLRRSRCC